jgi:hypothetical protein
VKLLTRISAFFAWNVVRQRDGFMYLKNAVTGQRRCHWDGSAWGPLRSGDVSYGPFGRQVVD